MELQIYAIMFLIQAVEAVPVSVSVKVVWDSGYSTDTSKSKIEAAIQEYLSTIQEKLGKFKNE